MTQDSPFLFVDEDWDGDQEEENEGDESDPSGMLSTNHHPEKECFGQSERRAREVLDQFKTSGREGLHLESPGCHCKPTLEEDSEFYIIQSTCLSSDRAVATLFTNSRNSILGSILNCFSKPSNLSYSVLARQMEHFGLERFKKKKHLHTSP